MRKSTTEWESQFLFALWDQSIMRVLEHEPRNIGFLRYVINSELDVLCRNWKTQQSQSKPAAATDTNGSER